MKPELRLETQQQEPQGCMRLLPPVVRAVLYRIGRLARTSPFGEYLRDRQSEKDLEEARQSHMRDEDNGLK